MRFSGEFALHRRALIAACCASLSLRGSLPPASRADGDYAVRSFARAGDEFDVLFAANVPLGISLRDLSVGVQPGQGATSRVLISDVEPDSQAAVNGVEIDQILVAVNGVNVERKTAEGVRKALGAAQAAGGKLKLTLKDATLFSNLLVDPPSRGVDKVVASTALTPSDSESELQVLRVTRTSLPRPCTRPASDGDLLEIAYEGRLANGSVFDGMQLALRQGDATIQFVLGKQPAGQFPPSWDVSLRGMCVGEQRTIEVPPVIGFGEKGLPKRGVPPNSPLVYDVELVAVNANTAP
uniref:peptidylprolyl isomerase n=1 Tax=Calcidiscus leptoporus TaxID=127549 RepID=A0A7S0JL83_9EUKA